VFLSNQLVGTEFLSAKTVRSIFYKSTPESQSFGTNWRSNQKSKINNQKSLIVSLPAIIN
jgi:hypothetical protein